MWWVRLSQLLQSTCTYILTFFLYYFQIIIIFAYKDYFWYMYIMAHNCTVNWTHFQYVYSCWACRTAMVATPHMRLNEQGQWWSYSTLQRCLGTSWWTTHMWSARQLSCKLLNTSQTSFQLTGHRRLSGSNFIVLQNYFFFAGTTQYRSVHNASTCYLGRFFVPYCSNYYWVLHPDNKFCTSFDAHNIIVITYIHCICGLHAFQYSLCLRRGLRYVLSIQKPDGSWEG